MKVVELFAGVGGFRVGLERVNADHPGEKVFYETVWSNQYEPSSRIQHASRVYCRAFGAEGHDNRDISLVPASEIPDHDMLVGGFPCQDYSVARILSQSAGIEGDKGVLWWQVVRILREKGERAPQFLLLENVDRLLVSPASQRGRDFAVILQSLDELGYLAEWRVINAADYGMPQRRRRTYILAYRKGGRLADLTDDPAAWILDAGVLARAFPVADPDGRPVAMEVFPLMKEGWKGKDDLFLRFNEGGKNSPFLNAGLLKDGRCYTCRTVPAYRGGYACLGDVLANGRERDLVTEEYYIAEDELPKWEYLKGPKHEVRRTKDGKEFAYSEGGMQFPDLPDLPSRTIITSEGGRSASRFKHVVRDPADGRLRRLIPLELERLNMFPDNHTAGETDARRAFLMGNALVCGIVTRIGEELKRRLEE